GYEFVNTERLSEIRGFNIVFNTVPKLIFDRELLQNTDCDTLLIDLASLPGGVDFDAASALRIDAQRALSLPGKCAPKTAGEIIKTTVFRMIEEVNR
ncbi:MAG: dipicolinate synthase, partial [Ruminococcus sp.]|nr:dipicolinate synthase [Ruminococcus sp.]